MTSGALKTRDLDIWTRAEQRGDQEAPLKKPPCGTLFPPFFLSTLGLLVGLLPLGGIMPIPAFLSRPAAWLDAGLGGIFRRIRSLAAFLVSSRRMSLGASRRSCRILYVTPSVPNSRSLLCYPVGLVGASAPLARSDAASLVDGGGASDGGRGGGKPAAGAGEVAPGVSGR